MQLCVKPFGLAGLRSALLDSENKQCTTCDDNPFVDPASGYVNTMTSHILLKRSSNKVVESAQVRLLHARLVLN